MIGRATTVAGLGAAVESGRSAPHAAGRARLRTLVGALTGTEAPRDGVALVATLADHLASADPSVCWLTLAVLRAELPLDADVVAMSREIRLDGPLGPLATLLTPSRNPLHRGRVLRRVEVVTGTTLVDLHHTAHTSLATGIQRVARQSAQRWARDHDITLVGWTADDKAIRRLDAVEQQTALHGGDAAGHRPGGDRDMVVPWSCTYVLPELATELSRTSRMLAMARYARSRTGVIGFDCVPLSSGETIGAAMGAAFANNLAAVRHMDRVATISVTAGREYEGWREMLTGTGLPGPVITPVPLAVEAYRPSEAAVSAAAATLLPDELPLVLCVGSHEPRKNHLALLQAAELAWRAGSRFRLTFVGGNAWGSSEFRDRLAELEELGRPVVSISAISDDLLWAAYRLARCVVFPSLNEGFGLPVAEAIATGTPVITSGFGSMAEIAEHGGALLVDPRDDHAVAAAIRTLVDDDDVHAELARQAATAPTRSWDEYAADVWADLVGSTPPPAS